VSGAAASVRHRLRCRVGLLIALREAAALLATLGLLVILLLWRLLDAVVRGHRVVSRDVSAHWAVAEPLVIAAAVLVAMPLAAHPAAEVARQIAPQVGLCPSHAGPGVWGAALLAEASLPPGDIPPALPTLESAVVSLRCLDATSAAVLAALTSTGSRAAVAAVVCAVVAALNSSSPPQQPSPRPDTDPEPTTDATTADAAAAAAAVETRAPLIATSDAAAAAAAAAAAIEGRYGVDVEGFQEGSRLTPEEISASIVLNFNGAPTPPAPPSKRERRLAARRAPDSPAGRPCPAEADGAGGAAEAGSPPRAAPPAAPPAAAAPAARRTGAWLCRAVVSLGPAALSVLVGAAALAPLRSGLLGVGWTGALLLLGAAWGAQAAASCDVRARRAGVRPRIVRGGGLATRARGVLARAIVARASSRGRGSSHGWGSIPVPRAIEAAAVAALAAEAAATATRRAAQERQEERRRRLEGRQAGSAAAAGSRPAAATASAPGAGDVYDDETPLLPGALCLPRWLVAPGLACLHAAAFSAWAAVVRAPPLACDPASLDVLLGVSV